MTFTWFDPPFRPEPPHCNQAYGICFTEAGMIVLGACDGDGERYWNLLGGGVEPAGHGRLRAQNLRLGIADAVTEPASTAAPIGGYSR